MVINVYRCRFRDAASEKPVEYAAMSSEGFLEQLDEESEATISFISPTSFIPHCDEDVFIFVFVLICF